MDKLDIFTQIYFAPLHQLTPKAQSHWYIGPILTKPGKKYPWMFYRILKGHIFSAKGDKCKIMKIL